MSPTSRLRPLPRLPQVPPCGISNDVLHHIPVAFPIALCIIDREENDYHVGFETRGPKEGTPCYIAPHSTPPALQAIASGFE
ncbi:hypothetical protein BGZ95_002706 [Linnemannia exigua]|uniref:Uncharacterized protein n=1 Tax=Linnemannia exigua TaxID=604196 RepID=A0AAD4H455_9FUNG|nr:hypothetical protein BGZ95_002706 [Linnemannia exigua]